MIRVILLLSIVFFPACGGVKDAITGKKKSASDEFLVEKKNPLVMPPDYGKLPEPTSSQSNEEKNKKNNPNEIKELLTDKENVSDINNQTNSTSLENSILEKIK